MRFLADMCVDVRIVRWLREQGHDATHLHDEGLHRMPNGEIFNKSQFQNVQVRLRSRKAKILTTGIHGVFRGLEFEPDAEIGRNGAL